MKMKKAVYLLIFVLVLIAVGVGIIVLDPHTISIIISVVYLAFLAWSKIPGKMDQDLFIIRYEKSFFAVVFLVVLLIQLTVREAEQSMPILMMLILFLIIAYLIFSWVYDKIITIRILKNEKLESELSLLKSQVNPHFFFNTLNNLYGLAISKSDETPAVILKLSEMMRYTISNGKKDKVKLKDEVNFLINYIELHKIRHHNKLTITVNQDIKDDHIEIAPLLLINLLENAFKHGAEKLDQNAYINMSITSTDKMIHFILENNYEPEVLEDAGTGLKNTMKRLNLIYPKQHNLEITKNENIFKVNLTILNP